MTWPVVPIGMTRQRGIVLFVVLVVLVVMTIASLALIRSVDTGNQIAGNLSFRQAGVQSGDAGIEAARTALLAASAADLEKNESFHGYFATWQDNFDPSTFDWASGQVVNNGLKDAAGNVSTWVVHRMCRQALVYTDPAAGCISTTGTSSTEGVSKAVLSYGKFNRPVETGGNPYYRITVRVVGPRNTVSYVQAVIS